MFGGQVTRKRLLNHVDGYNMTHMLYSHLHPDLLEKQLEQYLNAEKIESTIGKDKYKIKFTVQVLMAGQSSGTVEQQPKFERLDISLNMSRAHDQI